MGISKTYVPVTLTDVRGNPMLSSTLGWQIRVSLNGTAYRSIFGYARPNVAVSDAGWLIEKHTYDGSGNDVLKQCAVSGSDKTAGFDQIWDASSGLTITAITKAADAEVTTSTDHGYSTNDVVEITGSNATEANSDGYGSIVYTITKVNATKFTLGVNSSGWVGAGTSGTVKKKDHLNLTFA